ncbi:MAG: hypothetical protein H6945_14300 [Zoogloeaceae bacterium]|nr:hypothetical protein [Rhodocyclaceae bacterium]MCP5236902.1 hypothetical protein [Zoogloeaceae bacterium]
MRLAATLAALVIAGALLGGCATTGLGDNLGTDVSADGETVTLRWDGLHPMDQQLLRGYTQLFVEYQSGERLSWVREPVRSVRPAGKRALAFELPSGLGANPDGEVCLIFLVGGRTPLPVRAASDDGVDPVRFAYPEWSERLKARMAANRHVSEIERQKAELAAVESRLSRQQQQVAGLGIDDASACASAGVGRQRSAGRPHDVLDRPEHPEAARKVCLHRMRNAKALFNGIHAKRSSSNRDWARGGREDYFVLPAMLDDLADMVAQGKFPLDGIASAEVRKAQVAQYLADRKRWATNVGRNYLPPIGDADTYLTMTDAAAQSQFALVAERSANIRSDAIVVLGAALDIYDACVGDVTRQLETKLVAWQSDRRDASERQSQYRDFKAGQCRQAFELRDSLHADAERARATLAALEADAPADATDRSLGRHVLNSVTCGN